MSSETKISDDQLPNGDADGEPTETAPAIHAEHEALDAEEAADEAADEAAEESVDEAEEESTEAATEGAGTSRPEVQLQAIIDEAKSTRLAPGEEDRAIQLLKQTVAGGPKALPATIEAILTLPWSGSVKAVSDAWPETKPAGRARLIGGLAKLEGDTSRRIRLSLARGLHAQDPATAMKLVTGVCEAMGGAQGGSSTKDRQVFANVMLGKARPWIMNLSLLEAKPADALKIVVPALESCHQVPIFTQIWVLRWICDGEKFDALSPEHIDSIAKSIGRWQGRWHKELRKIIPKLPESLETALGPIAPKAPAAPEGEAAAAPVPPPLDPDDSLAALAAIAAGEPVGSEREEDDEDEDEEARERPRAQRPQRTEAPARGGRGERGGQFDLTRSLREIDSYVSRLKLELQQAQASARRQAPPSRSRVQSGPAMSAEETEELRRHNQQLEEQNRDLVTRIEDLTSDHEDRAATLEINDAVEQFKTFLGLKLKEDFADYSALSRESLNEVVRRHAHEILGRLFAVLQAEGVRFDA